MVADARGVSAGRRRTAAVLAAGLALTTTACTAPAPTGDELYSSAEARYRPFASSMHSVLMAVHEDEWAVGQKAHGAAPISCDDGRGYRFAVIRSATTPELDADETAARAVDAMQHLGISAESGGHGSGAAAERVIVGSGEAIERMVVTIRPEHGDIRVTAQTGCEPGEAWELSDLIFGDSGQEDRWRWLPAFEGPHSEVRFSFPADGPVHYDEDGTPILPPPEA